MDDIYFIIRIFPALKSILSELEPCSYVAAFISFSRVTKEVEDVEEREERAESL